MNQDNNTRGILLMLASMVAFSIADTLVKVSTTLLSPSQVLFLLLAGALIIYALIAKLQGEKLIDERAFSPLLLLRYVAEIAGMGGMVMALANVPLSSVGAITQASPMFATIGAVLFLGEDVGWRRWTSIVIGFIGVLLIIQPGDVEFDYAILWAVLAMVALSVRDLTTRLVPADMASISLATYTMIAAVPFTVGWVLLSGESFVPENLNWWLTIPMVTIGSIGYLLLIASLRAAEVAIVMPFRYARIIFLLVLGVLVFNERPNALMLLGAGLIIFSGTYMLWREQHARSK